MPKTNKKFDWEIYDSEGDFIDLLVMSRSEAKEYQDNHPEYKIQELGYTDDRRDNTWEIDSEERRNLYSVRISTRQRRIKNVHKTS